MTEPTASPAQLAANRANAQYSTGPVTEAGRAISSRNHTRHGLTTDPSACHPFHVLPTENQQAYDRRLGDFMLEWLPNTLTEFDLVHRLALHSWLRDRAIGLQDQLLASGLNDQHALKQFEIFGRYHTTHSRAFNKAFSDLMRLRNFQMRQKKDEALLARRAQETQIRFESQKRNAELHAAKMETLRIKQAAINQRNNRTKSAENTAPATENPLNETAATGIAR